MSSNAAKWFYTAPGSSPYLVTERLNATFWTARVVEYFWRCVQAGDVYRAEGYGPGALITLEWVPGAWLALKAPAGTDVAPLVEAISRRVLCFPASLTYTRHDGSLAYEWHRDGGDHRWSEVQGQPEYVQPRRI
jgi:hypothetical protein